MQRLIPSLVYVQ